MDDDVITALEEAIADLGGLLVQMDKFRAVHTVDARALRTVCLAIGDRARRAHRHGQLDPALARELSGDAGAARVALTAWLAGVRASKPYQDAVAALARADDRPLQDALLALYDGVAVVAPPEALFHPVAWQRRGRPRPADEVARELVRLRQVGFPGDRDPDAPGVDPSLPGIVLLSLPPSGAPIYLAVRGSARPPWVLALAATGDLVAPGAQVVLQFSAVLADPEDADLDAWALDPVAHRSALEIALRAHGVPIDESNARRA